MCCHKANFVLLSFLQFLTEKLVCNYLFLIFKTYNVFTKVLKRFKLLVEDVVQFFVGVDVGGVIVKYT